MSSALQVEHVDFVSVPVTDVERAVAFYRDTLELPQTNEGAWPEFRLGDNVFLYLVEPTRFGVEKWEPHTAQIALRVPDVAAAKEALEAKGVEFGAEIFDTGVCHMAFFHDPDGNALMFHRRYAPND
jgi:catechol 2,3-dioxygenase-like lactoylglutathione lyase family enzyme